MEKAEKKRGRPKGANSKTVRLEIRLTEEEYTKLEEMSVELDVSKSEIIRDGLRMRGNLYSATRK